MEDFYNLPGNGFFPNHDKPRSNPHLIISKIVSILVLLALFFSAKVNAQEFWGMANQGGATGNGVIFKIDTTGANYVVKHNFTSTTGGSPLFNDLVQTGGQLLGLTFGTQSTNNGALFSYNLLDSTYNPLHYFVSVSNGSTPTSTLGMASNGKFYSTTQAGGVNGAGTIFSFDPADSSVTKILDFNFSNGSSPYSSLVQSGNRLWGVTFTGGANNTGVIYKINPADNSFVKVHDFDGTNGGYPVSEMIDGGDGKLYGTTFQGGSSNAGTIYSFDMLDSTFQKLFDFSGSNGEMPVGKLYLENGALYGLASAGGDSTYGTLFKFDVEDSLFTRLHSFRYLDGSLPYSDLIKVNGKLYGMTNTGGSFAGGTIFSYTLASNTFTKIYDFNSSTGYSPLGSLTLVTPCSIQLFYQDADTDGYGNLLSPIAACTQPVGYVSNSTDCDDTDANKNPGETEVCDGVDNNCDGNIDEGVQQTFYADTDTDGYGDPGNSQMACTVPVGYVSDSTDCDDTNANKNPGEVEVCDGVDNDCDGTVDEAVQQTFYADNDNDGYGDAGNSQLACSAPTGFVSDSTDCNDADSTVYPGATEICDGIDHNCDGIIPVPPSANAGSDQTIYLGYSSSCVNLSASSTGGTGAYTFSWSTGATTASINVCPTTTTNYIVYVTDAAGCTDSDTVTVYVNDIRCGKRNSKIQVCYNSSTQCVSKGHANNLLSRGATLGPCSTSKIAIDQNYEFTAYPNPTSGQLKVDFNFESKENSKLIVRNNIGQVIIDIDLPAFTQGYIQNIDLEKYPAGIYLVEYRSNDIQKSQTVILDK